LDRRYGRPSLATAGLVVIGVQLSSSGSGSSSNVADSTRCSDSYFDDEFASERIMSRHRHLRLQTTLALDRPGSVHVSDEFRSPVVGRAPLQQRRTPALRDALTPSAQRTKSTTRDDATLFAEG